MLARSKLSLCAEETNLRTSKRLRTLKITVALLVTISLILAIAFGIPNTIAKKDSNKSKTSFRKSDNPITSLLKEKEKWLPLVPPEPVGRPLDEDLEKEIELLMYNIKTKKIKKI